jgi:ArsR family transcriptional regulator
MLTKYWHVGKYTNDKIKEIGHMITMEEAEIKSRIIKSMSHPVRLMIIDALKEREMLFSEIKEMFDFDKSTISKHLLVLKQAGVVSSKKSGVDMIYKLEVPCITDFFGCVTAVIEHNVMRQRVCVCR